MVTKRVRCFVSNAMRLILAKNHMVTKLLDKRDLQKTSLILAKNHMVTKQWDQLLTQ